MFGNCLLGVAVGASALLAQPNPASAPPAANRVELGRLSNATVTFVRAATGEWGIQISDPSAPGYMQPRPAQIQVYRGGDNATDLASAAGDI